MSTTPMPEVNRVEIIDSRGRFFGYYNVQSFAYSIQDDGQTFKVFVNTDIGKPQEDPT